MDKIKFKRTSTAGNVPTVAQCDKGELVINSTDRKLFTQDESGNIVELGASLAERYAMPKVQFDANREMNKAKFAGSGFVNWGKQYGGTESPSGFVNHGVWTYPASGYQNQFMIGRSVLPVGISRTNYPIVSMDGITQHLECIGFYTAHNKITLPPAPNGQKSYDSATGIVTDHLTYLDPKYDNTAALSQSDAVSRCFEGLVKNGDFRLGSESWGAVNDSIITVENGVLTGKSSHFSNLISSPTLTTVTGVDYLVEVKGLTCNQLWTLRMGGQYHADETQQPQPTRTDVSFILSRGGYNYFQLAGETHSFEFSCESISIRPVTSAPILTRQDLVFLESWQEDTSEKQVLLPLGNSQYGATTWNGIPLKKLTDLGVGQGYSAFGEWDADTVGYGVLISELTDAQLKKFLQDPKNNIYFDAETGKLIQCRYRVRVVEGCGNEWMGTVYNEAALQFDRSNTVIAQGGESVSPSMAGWITGAFLGTGNSYADETTKALRGIFKAQRLDIYALPIALRQTLNQGAYHPEFNSAGCKRVNNDTTGYTTGTDWHSSVACKITNQKQCFINVDASQDTTTPAAAVVTGVIGNQSGRPSTFPDAYFDAIYAHQIFDLRITAHKQDVNKLRVDAMRKAVAGEMRGWGKVPFSRFGTATVTMSAYASANVANKALYFATSDSTYPRDKSTEELKGGDCNLVILVGSNGNSIQIPFDGAPLVNWWPHFSSNVAYVYGCIDLNKAVADFNKAFPIGTLITMIKVSELTPQNDTLAWTDLVGSPENISKCFPNGCVGQWIPKLPDNVTPYNNIPLNRKALSGRVSRTIYIVAESRWITDTQQLDVVNNVINSNSSIPTGRVELWQYPTLSNFTEPANNSKVVGEVGDVFVTKWNKVDEGNRLLPSLIGSVGVGSGGGTPYENLTTLSRSVYRTGLMLSEPSLFPTHQHINVAGQDSPAVKALSTITEKDGLLYMQYHGRELHYDATAGNWGDDSTIPIVDGEGTMTDDNGHTVKTFCHIGQMPLGIASHSDSSQSS